MPPRPELMLGPNPRKLGTTVYVLAGLVALSAAWTYVTRVDVVVRAQGIVRPEGDIIRITSEFSGRIEAIHVQEGDSVVKGEALVQLDAAQSRSERGTLLQQISLLEEQLENIGRGIKDAAEIHTLSTRQLDQEISFARRELSQRRLEHAVQLKAAAVQLEATQVEHTRAQKLHAAGLVSRQDWDRIETDLNVARHRHEEIAYRFPSEADLNSLVAARLLSNAEFKARQRDRQAEGAPIEAQLSRLHAQLEQAQRERDRRVIRSPSSGQITLLPAIHPGEHITEGSLIGALASTPIHLIVEVLIGNSEARDVTQGQAAWLRIDESETIGGTVASVSPDARFNETSAGAYRVVVIPDPADLRLGQGMDVRVITGRQRLLMLLFHRIERVFEE